MMWWSRKPRILVKGTHAERPWAATLAAIRSSALSGELVLQGDSKDYRIAFANGKLVGAVSPMPSDCVQRIALTCRVAPAANIAAAMRIVGRSDDIAKFADSAGLAGESATLFKRRVLVQRAARTFAVERGTYVVSDRITIPIVADTEVDACAAIYRGMRTSLSEQRLGADLRTLGARFILHPEDAEHTARFDFDPEAEPILEALRSGTSAAELEATFRALDSRLIYAVLGSLAACRVITPIDGLSLATQDISIARAPTPREPTASRVPTLREPTVSRVPTPRQPISSSSSPVSLHQTPGREQIEQQLAYRIGLLEAGADLFTFLGLPFDAPVEHVRARYLEFAHYLHPDRIAELGVHDRYLEAGAVLARAVFAMTVLTDEARRAEYVASIWVSRPFVS